MTLKEWKQRPWNYYYELGGARVWVADQLNLKPNMKVLDVGSGDGFFSIQSAKKYRDVKFIGIELSEEWKEAIENAKEEGVSNTEFYRMNAYNIEYSDNYFDVSVLFLSLRNIARDLKQANELLREIKRVTKRNGKIAIAEVFPENLENERQKLAVKIYEDCSDEKEFEKFHSMADIKKILGVNNLKIEKIKNFKTGSHLTVEETREFIEDEAENKWREVWNRHKSKN